jgi:hypothetical protein
MEKSEIKEIDVKVVIGEFHIKKEEPKEIHLRREDDMCEMYIRQELPEEIIEWFKTL